MSDNPSLSVTQLQVLALISAGFTATAAAAQAGVHRNTVVNWLHSDEFRTALEDARTRKQLLYWDQAETLAEKALSSLSRLMDDPEIPAHVRLKATIALLNHARQFLPSETTSVVLPEPPAPVPAPEIAKTVHKNAQQKVAPPTAVQSQPAASRPSPVVFGPKIGRNDLCPCGSGTKFKRCCLAKTGRMAENAPAA